MGTINGWPLAHKELLRPLTAFGFNPAECPYPYTLLTRKPGGGDGIFTDNPTMKPVSAGLHGTCSKSQIKSGLTIQLILTPVDPRLSL